IKVRDVEFFQRGGDALRNLERTDLHFAREPHGRVRRPITLVAPLRRVELDVARRRRQSGICQCLGKRGTPCFSADRNSNDRSRQQQTGSQAFHARRADHYAECPGVRSFENLPWSSAPTCGGPLRWAREGCSVATNRSREGPRGTPSWGTNA